MLYSISIFYLLLCYLFCHHDVIILNVNFDFFFFEFEFVRNGHYQTLYGKALCEEFDIFLCLQNIGLEWHKLMHCHLALWKYRCWMYRNDYLDGHPLRMSDGESGRIKCWTIWPIKMKNGNCYLIVSGLFWCSALICCVMRSGLFVSTAQCYSV